MALSVTIVFEMANRGDSRGSNVSRDGVKVKGFSNCGAGVGSLDIFTN